jgi:hypothetical protein
MGRTRIYATNADRQYAYRRRHPTPKRRKRRRPPAYFSRVSDLWETSPARFEPLHREFRLHVGRGRPAHQRQVRPVL